MRFLQRARLLFNDSAFGDYIRAFIRGDDIPGIDGNIDSHTAMKYTAVFSCVRVLSETLASMPVMVYKKNKDGSRDQATDIGIYDILHNRPNEEMSPFSFKESSMIALNLGGNAVSERLVNKHGNLVGLYPYPWNMVDINRDKETGRLVYRIRDGTIQGRTLTRDQVFHVPGMSFDGVVGLSPIEYVASAIRLGLTYEKFGNNFYKNGAHSSGVFTFPNALSDTAFQRLKEGLGKEYTGLLNVGKPMLLEEGGQFQGLTINPVDAQLLESKKFQTEDIARIYRVPLHLIQNLDKATNNNIEHQSLEFIMYTMLPWAQRWEQAVNSQLLTAQEREAGYYTELKMDSMLRGDLKSRYEAYAQGIQWGILSINDCLKLENMNTVPDGDRRIQPLNMISISKADEYYSNDLTDQKNRMLEQLVNIIEMNK